MRGTIYIIKNMINDKYYVGQTKGLPRKRFDNHKYLARQGYGYILHAAIRKYGEDNFEIIEEIDCEIDELNNIERDKIIQYNSVQPNGYNILDYGSLANLEEGWWKGKKRAESTKRKISETKLKDPPIGEKNPFYGRKHTKETRQILAEKNKNVWSNLTDEQKEKHRIALTGHITSEETKAKISKANKGKIRTEEHKAKISKANTGRVQSEEERKMRSERLTGHKKSDTTNMVKAQRKRADREKGLEIHRLIKQGLKGTEIAKIIGCTPEFIYKVKKGERYGWVFEDE